MPIPRGALLEPWRRWALLIFLFGCLGTAVELVLLGHYAEPWQWAPLLLLGSGVAVGGGFFRSRTAGAVKGLRGVATAFLAAGFVGVFLHLKANVEFELELRPSMAGTELFVETLRGAIPALAPGTMVLLGFLGLLVCFRHPSLSGGTAR